MSFHTPVAISDSVSDVISNPDLNGSSSHNELDLLPFPTPPNECAEKTSRVPTGTHSQFSTPVRRSSVSDDGPPVHEEPEGTTTAGQLNESIVTAKLPWDRRALACLTLYSELYAAHTPEEFASVRMRFRQEWTFAIGVLIALSAVNAATFAITPDTIFKINSYTYIAVAISSTACGLGISCAIWFLLRYSWVKLETFIERSHDVYGSYIFFSLSSRTPMFCMLLSSISLMAFLGLVAYHAWPVGVLVIVLLVVLVMLLQFIVYGTHQFAAYALNVWRAGRVSIGNVLGFQSLGSGG